MSDTTIEQLSQKSDAEIDALAARLLNRPERKPEFGFLGAAYKCNNLHDAFELQAKAIERDAEEYKHQCLLQIAPREGRKTTWPGGDIYLAFACLSARERTIAAIAVMQTARRDDERC